MVRLMGSATGVPPMRRLHDLHGRAFHEPAVPERGSVTRRTWGCSDALRLTEPRSHRVVRFMVPMHAKKRKGTAHEPPPRPRFGDLDSRMRTTTSRRTKGLLSASRFTGQTTSNNPRRPPDAPG